MKKLLLFILLSSCSTVTYQQAKNKLSRNEVVFDSYFEINTEEHKEHYAISSAGVFISSFNCIWHLFSSDLIVTSSMGNSKEFTTNNLIIEKIKFPNLKSCENKIDEIFRTLKQNKNYIREF